MDNVVSNEAIIALLKSYDYNMHRWFSYGKNILTVIENEVPSIPKQFKSFPSLLKYVKIDLLGDMFTMNEVLRMLSDLTVKELHDCIDDTCFLDMWLSQYFTIGEVKEFFRYLLRSRGFNPKFNFLMLNSKKELFEEFNNGYIEAYATSSKWDNLEINGANYVGFDEPGTITLVRKIYDAILHGKENVPFFTRIEEFIKSGGKLHMNDPIRNDIRHFIRESYKFIKYPEHIEEFASERTTRLDVYLASATLQLNQDSTITITFPPRIGTENPPESVIITKAQIEEVVATSTSIA